MSFPVRLLRTRLAHAFPLAAQVYAVALYVDPFSFSARMLTMDPELAKRDLDAIRRDPRFYKMLISATFSCCFALHLVRGLSKAQLASGFSEV